MRNLMRNLTVFVVDAIAYPIGWAIDRTWDKFDFDDYEDKR